MIVTGGASGIGLQIARDLATNGHQVTVWDIKAPPADSGLAFEAVDLTRPEDIRRAAGKAPAAVHGFVHCAGVFKSTTILGDDLADAMLLSFRIHTLAFVLATQALVGKLAADKGAVVAITSAGADMVYPGTIAYGPSKAALARAITQLAVELGGRGIRVNGVSPGAIATDMTRHLWNDPEFAAERTRYIPLGRQAEPVAVSDAVAFLLSPAAGYVTGEILWVDGGVRHGIFQTGVRALLDGQGQK